MKNMISILKIFMDVTYGDEILNRGNESEYIMINMNSDSTTSINLGEKYGRLRFLIVCCGRGVQDLIRGDGRLFIYYRLSPMDPIDMRNFCSQKF